MSALDDLLARDTGAAAAPATVVASPSGDGSALDALLARDTGSSASFPRDASIPRVDVTGLAEPQEKPGGLKSFAGGLGHGFGSAMLGVQQLAGEALKGMGSTSAGPWLVNDANQGLKRIDSEYAPLSDAHPVIAGTGNIGGQVAATMLPASAIARAAPAYSAMGLAGRVALGAGQGAAGAAMMPVQNLQPDESFAGQKLSQIGLGTALGGAAPVVTASASALGRGAWNVLQPLIRPGQFVGRGMAQAMEPADAALAAANIRNAPQLVPGSLPTTAQAAQTPFMVQTEKAASNLPTVKNGMIQRAIENNDARWAAINQVAGTPADLAAAQAARTQAAAPLYAAAHAAAAPVDAQLGTLMQRPAVQQAMQAADTLARNEGVQLAMPTVQNPTISGQALDYAHRALGDMIDTAQRAGSNQQVRALTGAQDELRQWGQTNIPQVAQAARTFAQMSAPVNTMEAGQQIANTMGGRAMNAAGVPDIQLAGYRTALAQAMREAEHGIDPAAQNALQGIGQDLQRATVSNAIRSPGSDTAYNLAANGWLARNLYGPSFEGATGLGKTVAAGATLLSGHPMAAAGVYAGGNQLGRMVGGRLENRLSGLLLNPNTLLPYLDARAAAAAQPVQGALMQGLLNYGRPAAIGGLLGGLIEPGRE